MWRKVLLTLVSVSLCAGQSCSISCNGTPVFPGVYVELDRANCTLEITQSGTAAEATATATITDGNGRPVELTNGQSVSVNGQDLAETSRDGEYTQSVPATEEYTVTVTEPSRGVQTTTISAPGDFDITSPPTGGSASLSGFTLSFSNPDANLQVTITLTQVIFGEENRQVIGPVSDTGNLVLDADDLGGFQQGANLSVTVAKINERSTINGFNVAQLTVERSETLLVVPAP